MPGKARDSAGIWYVCMSSKACACRNDVEKSATIPHKLRLLRQEELCTLPQECKRGGKVTI